MLIWNICLHFGVTYSNSDDSFSAEFLWLVLSKVSIFYASDNLLSFSIYLIRFLIDNLTYERTKKFLYNCASLCYTVCIVYQRNSFISINIYNLLMEGKKLRWKICFSIHKKKVERYAEPLNKSVAKF